jgi:hypothetical protein
MPGRDKRAQADQRHFVKERCKIHDVVLQGINLALRKRGYPPLEELKVGKRR